MKSKFKLVVIAALLIITVGFSAFAFAGFVRAENTRESVNCFSESDEICYVLREYEGYIAIYVENEPNRPMTITDIHVSTLRTLDRQLLETGIKIYSRDRLMMTLEDLGS